jgi:multidrug efflux pump subunit AcrB
MVDELLSREDRSIFEDLYSAGTARLVAKTEKLSQSTLLAYGLLEIATSFGEDEPEMAFNLIAENIAEFNADPAKITQEIAQHLLDTEQVVLTGEDTDTMVSPPETRMGAKAALENLQIRLKQQEIGLEALASVFTNLTEPRSKPTNQMLIKEMGELLAALDKCPEPGDALSVLFDLSEEEMTNSISFKR